VASSDRYRRVCAGLLGATVDNVFGDQTDVFRIANKMFALVSERTIRLKSTPEESEALRAQYDWIRPAYHMNKRHWIMIDLASGADLEEEIGELIIESYRLVVEGLPKSKKPAPADELR
jgi:predicted DNA-binding protein (MmcQ/YjbR family)